MQLTTLSKPIRPDLTCMSKEHNRKKSLTLSTFYIRLPLQSIVIGNIIFTAKVVMIDSLIVSTALENDLRNLLGNICLLICKYEKLGLGIYPESKNRTKQKKREVMFVFGSYKLLEQFLNLQNKRTGTESKIKCVPKYL